MLVGDFVYDMEAVHIKINCVVGKNLFFNHFIVVVLDTISNEEEACISVYKAWKWHLRKLSYYSTLLMCEPTVLQYRLNPGPLHNVFTIDKSAFPCLNSRVVCLKGRCLWSVSNQG